MPNVISIFSAVIDEILGDPSDSESTDCEPDPEPSSRPASRGRRDVISPELVGAIDAAKLGNKTAADFLSAAGASFGVDLQGANINPTTIYRKRKKLRAECVSSMKAIADTHTDRVLTVRWDGKRVESLGGAGPSHTCDQEREAVIVDGVTTEILLGAPALPSGSAEAICCALCSLLEEWKIYDKVRAAGFDTTTVNSGKLTKKLTFKFPHSFESVITQYFCTGWLRGVAVRLEAALARELLCLPCRHHVFERILEAVFKDRMGPTSGPEDPIFKDLKSKWGTIDKFQFSTFKDITLTRRHLASCADEIIQFAETQIQASSFQNNFFVY